MTCPLCSKPGHLAPKCRGAQGRMTQPRKTFGGHYSKCNKKGHRDEECRSKARAKDGNGKSKRDYGECHHCGGMDHTNVGYLNQSTSPSG